MRRWLGLRLMRLAAFRMEGAGPTDRLGAFLWNLGVWMRDPG